MGTVKPLAVLLLLPFVALRADEAPGDLETCTFVAHTPVGTLSGACTTQDLRLRVLESIGS